MTTFSVGNPNKPSFTTGILGGGHTQVIATKGGIEVTVKLGVSLSQDAIVDSLKIHRWNLTEKLHLGFRIYHGLPISDI